MWNLGLLRVNHDGDKAAIAGTVKGQEVKSIGSAAKHALTGAVCRVSFIGYLVNLFLSAKNDLISSMLLALAVAIISDISIIQ